jgi:uncharacterized protein YkwD
LPRPLPRSATLLATLTVLLAGLLTATTAPASAKIWKVPAPDASLDPLTHLTEFENRIVVQINKRRDKADLKPVRYFDSCVDRFSERWARHLAETGEFVHRNQRKILRRCDLTWVGETLVRGTALTPAGAVKAWMHSPGHRAVIMKPRANRAGVGVRIDGQGRFVGVLNFGDTN